MLASGDFLSILINFPIVALALFFVVKGMNALKKPSATPAAPPPRSDAVALLTQIRDALARC